MNFSMGPRSLILFIAFLQGLFFAAMLLRRGTLKKQVQDFILAALLFALATSLISYIIGFMGVYDMAREQGWDLSFFPFGNGFLLAPLAYLYVCALTDKEFSWSRNTWRHLVPAALYYIYSLVMWSRPYAVKEWFWKNIGWVDTTIEIAAWGMSVWYIYKAWRRLGLYRHLVAREYSNAGSRTLQWLAHFIWGAVGYYLLALIFKVTGELFQFFYTEWFYLELIRAAMLYYLSVAGWNFAQKSDLDFERVEQRETLVSPEIQPETTTGNTTKAPFPPDELEIKRRELEDFMQNKEPWRDEELSLPQLSAQLQMTPVQLSALVNSGIGKNFNDFVNEYRVRAVIQRLHEGAGKQFSLLGIAYECGFNSKATFNRAFKKYTGKTPGEFA